MGVSEVDAIRTAFTVLAAAQGWPKAKVGRYLGVSRARVAQKLERVARYADEIPALQELLAQGADQPLQRDGEPPVGFERERWEDLSFARHLLSLVNGRPG